MKFHLGKSGMPIAELSENDLVRIGFIQTNYDNEGGPFTLLTVTGKPSNDLEILIPTDLFESFQSIIASRESGRLHSSSGDKSE